MAPRIDGGLKLIGIFVAALDDQDKYLIFFGTIDNANFPFADAKDIIAALQSLNIQTGQLPTRKLLKN